MVFLENVKGLKSHNKGKTLRTILDTLKELGYYPHWTILSSLDYGLPQKRERWYCVAFRTDVNFEWPKPIKGHPVLRDIIDMDDKNPSLAIPKFELDRIDYHFANAKPGDRIQHDNSKYKPNTKKENMAFFLSKNQMVLCGFMLAIRLKRRFKRHSILVWTHMLLQS